jgi:preprotein translocase subunit SecF
MDHKQTAEKLVHEEKKDGQSWYALHYKQLLIIPLLLLLLSIGYMAYFYQQNGDFIRKDVTLTGGTSITVFVEGEVDILELRELLSETTPDISIRELSDFRTGSQQAIIIESQLSYDEVKPLLETFLGYQLTGENVSVESTGATLGDAFYKQLLYAIIISFSFMAIVVLFLFGGRFMFKAAVIVSTLVPLVLFFSRTISITTGIILNALLLLIQIPFYFRYSVPSAAVVISAFADIFMTLALVNFLGMRLSSAGIIAFLMLIGYSVDTDIMLTTRLLKRDRSKKQLVEAFKTGITMALTSIIVISVALLFTQSFSEVLRQIFTILLIGLGFDILNTWITNASILLWYLEVRQHG